MSSMSIGGRGASFHVPVNRRGGPRTTAGLPGPAPHPGCGTCSPGCHARLARQTGQGQVSAGRVPRIRPHLKNGSSWPRMEPERRRYPPCERSCSAWRLNAPATWKPGP
ncbi:MAG: hypothetical protein ACK587_06600 [Cyanobacteriota bacterium]